MSTAHNIVSQQHRDCGFTPVKTMDNAKVNNKTERHVEILPN